jgi:hypothetical protein
VVGILQNAGFADALSIGRSVAIKTRGRKLNFAKLRKKLRAWGLNFCNSRRIPAAVLVDPKSLKGPIPRDALPAQMEQKNRLVQNYRRTYPFSSVTLTLCGRHFIADVLYLDS